MKQLIRKKFTRAVFNFILMKTCAAKYKKAVLWTGWFFVCLIAFFALHPVLAQDAGATASSGGGVLDFGVNKLIEFTAGAVLMVARLFISITVFALKFFIELAKYNGYVDAPIVLVGWTMVRDVANMFFVVVLLVIAFGTILGAEQYEWKKTLVNFILAAVLVNFSKLIAGLFIDAAYVFTITFLNAITATAGGNLIGMFHLTKILSIAGNSLEFGENIGWAVFGGALMALVFASIAMMMMGAYLVIMTFRVVMLWVLVILSPLAYIMNVIPQTKSYAQEWWHEFGNYVITAPVMVFFMWLAFATLGSGDFVSSDLGLQLNASQVETEQKLNFDNLKGNSQVSISEVSSWENMANFLIAIAFLFAGIERVQKLGVRGGSMLSSAVDFGKKVGTIASGYAAGRWMVGKGAEWGGKGLKAAAWHAPLIGGESLTTKAKTQWVATKGMFFGKGADTTKRGDELKEELKKDTADLASLKAGGRLEAAELAQLKEDRETLVHGGATEDSQAIKEIDQKITEASDKLKAVTGLSSEERASQIKTLEEGIEKKSDELGRETGKGVLGYFAKQSIAEQKRLAKMEKQAEKRREILWKKTSAVTGGYHLGEAGFGIGIGTRGIGIGKYRILGDKYAGVENQDRIERGWLQAEEMRSKAKDQEFEQLGLYQGLEMPRIKIKSAGGVAGVLGFKTVEYQYKKGNLQTQIMEHQEMTEMLKAKTDKLQSEARLRISLDGQKIGGRNYDSNMATLSPGGHVSYTAADIAAAKVAAKVAKDTVAEVTSEEEKRAMTKLFDEGRILDALGQDIEKGLFDSETQRLRAVLKANNDAQKQAKAAIQIEIGDETLTLSEAEAQRDAKIKEKLELGIEAREEAIKSNEDELRQLREKHTELSKVPKKETAEQKTKRMQAINRINGLISPLESSLTQQRADLNKAKSDATPLEQAIVALSSGIEIAEQDLEQKDPQFLQRKQEIEDTEDAIQQRSGEVLRYMADGVRKGNAEIIESVVGEVQRSDMSTTQKEEAIKKLRRVKELSRSGALAWRFAARKGHTALATKGLSFSQNSLLSDAEQREVHDRRGLDTPKNTMTELLEQYTREFSDMTLNNILTNAPKLMMAMIDRAEKNNGELSSEDRAMLMGFMKRGFDKSWIDDMIYGIRGDRKAKAKIANAFGWKNDDFTKDKIRDLQMFFASGANLKFVRDNSVITQIADACESEFGMEFTDVQESLKTGVFKNSSGQNITGEVRDRVRTYMKEKLMSFSAEQEQIFQSFFEQDSFGQTAEARILEFDNLVRAHQTNGFVDADGAAKLKQSFREQVAATEDALAVERTKAVDEWLRVQEDHQDELQFVSNLRDEALRNGHAENAGWANAVKVADGRTLYLARGARQANAHVLGDAKKMKPTQLADFQTHSYARITESGLGQMILDIDEEEYQALRRLVADPNTWRNTNQRDRLLRVGLTSIDDATSFRNSDSSFNAGALRDARGQFTRAAQQWAEKYKEEKEGRLFSSISEQEQMSYISSHLMEHNFVKQMRGNMSDFLMTLAEVSGVNQLEAMQEGKINIRLYNPHRNESVHYTKVQDLIEDYNEGHWNENKPVARKLSNFIPKGSTSNGKKGKKKPTADDAEVHDVMGGD
jgi:hypothetical protein